MNKKLYVWLPVLAVALFMVCAGMAFAAQPASKGPGKVTTKIDAENMVYDSAKQQVVFSRNVTVTHPDFTIKAATMTLYLSSTSNTGAGGSGGEKTLDVEGGKVERIVAEKNVRITLPEGRKAVCERGTYYVAENRLVMDGTPRPVLTENQNNISANVIYFYMDTNKSEAQGDVKVNFVSEGTDKKTPAVPAAGQ